MGAAPPRRGRGIRREPIVIAIGCLWWHRRRFGLTIAHSVLLSLEVLVCPAFLPNLVRKITAGHPLQIDGGQVLSVTAAPEIRGEILTRLAGRAEELIETAGPGSSESDELQHYLVTLRGGP